MKEELQSLSVQTQNALQAAMSQMQEDLTVEQVTEQLETNEKGKVRNSLSNCVTVFRLDPLLRGSIRYNCLTQREDVVRQIGWDRKGDGSALNDNDLYRIHLYCEETYGITAARVIEEALHIVSHENKFHPVQDYLNSLEWDGTERVRYALHHFLGADTTDYTYEVLKFFMLGAVSRAFYPGIKFDYILCVVGGQGAGKSTFFRLLAVRDEWFTDDLKELESEKVYQKLQGHWIIEMSEMLATNNAKSNEAIKSFLSRQKETYRTPYERYPKDRPRQCVFAGTTNKVTFLPRDRTGNRRFLPVRCNETESEVFILDDERASRAYIDQMWAEIMEIYRRGNVRLKLSKEMTEQVSENQRRFMQEDVDAGVLLAFMEDYDGDRVCSKMLYKEALDHEYKEPQRWETNEICESVNQMIADGTLTGWRYFDQPKRFFKYGSQKGWERVTENVNEGVSTEDGFLPVPEQMELPFD